jgi:hypothetical protein
MSPSLQPPKKRSGNEPDQSSTLFERLANSEPESSGRDGQDLFGEVLRTISDSKEVVPEDDDTNAGLRLIRLSISEDGENVRDLKGRDACLVLEVIQKVRGLACFHVSCVLIALGAVA